MIRGALAAIAIAAAAPAAAETPKVLPLDGPQGDAGAVTTAIAGALGAEVAAVAIDDAAGVLGCVVDEPACLDAVARSLAADVIVFGEIGDGGAVLTRYARGEAAAQQTFALAGATPDARARGLVVDAATFLGLRGPAADADPPTAVPAIVGPAPGTTPAPTTTAPRRGTPGYVWAVIAGGAITAGVGGGFLWSARSLRDDVADAPTATRDDFDRLTALEATGRRRTRIGGALMIAGGAALVTGVVLAIVHGQGVREARDATALRVEPAIVPGGAMVVVSIGGP